MAIIAINKAHQKNINKAYNFYRKYHALVNQDDDCCLYSNELSKNNDKQENAFNRYLSKVALLIVYQFCTATFAKCHAAYALKCDIESTLLTYNWDK